MSINVSYVLPASEEVLARTRNEFIAFLNTLKVEDAEVGSFGVVKKASAVTYTFWSEFGVDTSFTAPFPDGAGGLILVEVPTKEAFDNLKAKFQALHESYNSLLIKLKVAGVVTS